MFEIKNDKDYIKNINKKGISFNNGINHVKIS